MVLKLPSSTSKLIFTYVHSFKQQATTNSIKQDILHVQPSASQTVIEHDRINEAERRSKEEAERALNNSS